MKIIIRSKAPLRLGLAGGGTDVSPFSDLYGGAIINATINMYAYTTIEPTDDGKIVFDSPAHNLHEEFDSEEYINPEGFFVLHKGVYNRVVKDFVKKPLSFKMSTFVDTPPGSGLGTSSTLVVSILGAFVEWLKLPLGEYDVAHLAYDIERNDLNMSGGKQDQYAATFGGINFMEFFQDRVIVNPLRVRQRYLDELSHNILLFFTNTCRVSANIIEEQKRNVLQKNTTSVNAMFSLKEQAIKMKEVILKGNLDEVGSILDTSWQEKKKMANCITNPLLDSVYNAAIEAGSTGGKVAGAGGGGFMFFYCPGVTRYAVMEALKNYNGEFKRYEFTKDGLKTWAT